MKTRIPNTRIRSFVPGILSGVHVGLARKRVVPFQALLAALLAVGTAYALSNSVNDDDTPAANAVVDVGGCTGTLVSPRVILTASHCLTPPTRPPWGDSTELSRDRGPLAFSRGSLYLTGGSPSRLYARTVGTPLITESDVYDGPEFTAMAPVPGRILGLTADGELYAYSLLSIPGVSGWLRLGIVAPDLVGMAVSGSHLYGVTRGRDLVRATVSDPLTWTRIGAAPAVDITAMTAAMGTIFATTGTNRLLVFDPVRRRFSDAGHANRVVALTTVNDRLVAQAESGRIGFRTAVPWEENWEDMGTQAEIFATIAVAGNELFGVLADGRSVRARIGLTFADIGEGPGAITSLTANTRQLFAVTTGGRILSREARWDNRRVWTDVGSSGGSTIVAASDSALYGYRPDGTLSQRTLTGTGWVPLGDSGRPANIGIADFVDGQLHVVTTGSPSSTWRRNGLGPNAGYTQIMTQNAMLELAGGAGFLYSFTNNGKGRLWRSNARPGFGNAWVTVEDYLAAPGAWTTFASAGVSAPTVSFGARKPFAAANQVRPDAFMIAGNADIAFLRLPAEIPAERAVPIPISVGSKTLPANPAAATPFTLVGWGCLPSGATPVQRQRATANGGFNWPTTSLPGGSTRHQVTVLAGSAGGATSQGDSGGPLLYGSPPRVIGVMNIGASCGSSGTQSTYAITFLPPYTDSTGTVRPATSRWIKAVLSNMSDPRITLVDRFINQAWSP